MNRSQRPSRPAGAFALAALLTLTSQAAFARGHKNTPPITPVNTTSGATAAAPAATTPAPAAPPAAPPPPATASPSDFTIHFDTTAVRRLIAMVKAHDENPADIDSWLDLPANKHLVQVGVAQGSLTRDQLKANLIQVLEARANPQNQPSESYGCVRVDPIDAFSHMLDLLEQSADARAARIAQHVAQFAPPGVRVNETVYIHLGGDWDAINDGGIFINMRFWQGGQTMSWEGIDMIVAHETMHNVQTAAYGNPEDQATGPGSWFTALSKIQREGTARYVEYDTDPVPYHPVTYGFIQRAIDTERGRAFRHDIDLLTPLYAACFPTFDHSAFRAAYEDGIDSGGAYYDIGAGIAQAIDDKLGRAALIASVAGGPKVFYGDYLALTKTNPDLPKLPDPVATAVAALPDRIDPGTPAPGVILGGHF